MHLKNIQLIISKIDFTDLLHVHNTNMEIAKHSRDQWQIRYMKRENQRYLTIFHVLLNET